MMPSTPMMPGKAQGVGLVTVQTSPPVLVSSHQEAPVKNLYFTLDYKESPVVVRAPS